MHLIKAHSISELSLLTIKIVQSGEFAAIRPVFRR